MKKLFDSPKNRPHYSILFLEAGASGKGGSFVSLLQLLRLLSADKHDLHVVLWNDSPYIREFKALGANVIRMDNPIYTIGKSKTRFFYNKLTAVLLRFFPSALPKIECLMQYVCYKQLIRIARQAKVDFLHLNNQPIRNFIGFWLARRLQLPVISHLRTLHGYGLTSAHVDFMKKVNCKMISVSSNAAQYWKQLGLPTECINTIHNPYDGILMKEAFAKKNAGNKLVYVGRLEKGKGVDVLLRSFLKMLKSVPTLSLTIIGDGDCRDSLLAITRQLAIEEKVTFSGYVENAKKVIPQFDILILPSQSEGFGRVLVEAMANNVAVIGSNLGGITDIIRNEENGLLVEYGDEVGLMNAALSLVNNNGFRLKLLENAYQTVKEKFQEDLFYKRILTVYQSLLVTTHPSSSRASEASRGISTR